MQGQKRGDVFILSSNSSTLPLKICTCRWMIHSMSTLFYWSDANVCRASFLFPSLHFFSIPHSSTASSACDDRDGINAPKSGPLWDSGTKGEGGRKRWYMCKCREGFSLDGGPHYIGGPKDHGPLIFFYLPSPMSNLENKSIICFKIPRQMWMPYHIKIKHCICLLVTELQ